MTAAQQNCHIGIKRVATDLPYYSYMKGSQQFPLNHPIIETTPADTPANLITLAMTKTKFIRHIQGATATAQATDQACYICQYDLE